MVTGRRHSGHTLIEMVVTISVMAILASAILPLAAMTSRRAKEIELRRALRELRAGIDMYHEVCMTSLAQKNPGQATLQVLTIKVEDDPGATCYPKDLELLVEGVETSVARYKLKFLRRIPRDPFNRDDDEHDQFGWVLRATTDDPEREGSWNKQNVFDVRTASEAQALDGSYYKEW